MNRAIAVLSWPILVEALLNSLVGVTDTVLAAGLAEGEAAATAIGGGAYVFWFIGLVLMAVEVGATALVSRAMGAGRRGLANTVTAQAVMLGAAAGVAVGAAIALSAGTISTMLSMSPSASIAFRDYMLFLALGAPFMGVLFAGTACARGAGDSLRPLWAMAAVNVVNILLSWALVGVDLTVSVREGDAIVTHTVLANPFGLHFGVAGIGAGTAVAHAVGALVIVLVLVRGRSGVVLRRRRLRPHAATLRRLLRLGLPNFLETSSLWFGNFLVIVFVGWLSTEEELLGVHIVAARIEAFSYLPGFAFGTAAATLVGQYLGAGSPAMARRAGWRCCALASAAMGFAGLLFLLVPTPIVGLFSPQPLHLDRTPPLLMIAGAVQIPFAVGIVLRSALRGAGDVRAVLWLTLVTTYGVRLPLAYLFSGVDVPLPDWAGGGVIPNPMPIEPSLAGLWVGLCAELVVRGVLFVIRFAGDGWTRVRV